MVGNGSAAIVTADFEQSATGLLRIGIAGTSGAAGEFGVLEVTGEARLGGMIDAVLENAFVPVVTDFFDVVTFGTTSGSFVNNSIDLGAGIVMEPQKQANAIRLVTTSSP